MDADLVPFLRDLADLARMQQGGDGGIEEARLDAMPAQQRADARHALTVAVLPLADPHRALVGVAQRDRLVIGIEGEADGAARPARPGCRLQRAPGAGAADDLPPLRLGPFPGVLGEFGHEGFPVPLLAPCCALDMRIGSPA
jgi:hypothetical protein